MCRDSGQARQQVEALGARVDQLLQHLQAAAAQAMELREALRSTEQTITVTPVPAAHADQA